jgi:hypothetical protein
MVVIVVRASGGVEEGEGRCSGRRERDERPTEGTPRRPRLNLANPHLLSLSPHHLLTSSSPHHLTHPRLTSFQPSTSLTSPTTPLTSLRLSHHRFVRHSPALPRPIARRQHQPRLPLSLSHRLPCPPPLLRSSGTMQTLTHTHAHLSCASRERGAQPGASARRRTRPPSPFRHDVCCHTESMIHTDAHTSHVSPHTSAHASFHLSNDSYAAPPLLRVVGLRTASACS